jgi:hypothetical protein
LAASVHRPPSKTRGMPRAVVAFRGLFDAGQKALLRALPRVKGRNIADIIARYLTEEMRGQVCSGQCGGIAWSSCLHRDLTRPHALPAMPVIHAGGAPRAPERFHHPES